MTTKQIAEAVGKPERTVKGWATKAGAKLASAGAKLASAGHGKAADWDLDEACLIIEIGLGKNAAALYRENAKRPASTDIVAIVRETVQAMIPAMVEGIRYALGAAQPIAKAPALPAPAPLTPRDELRRVMVAAGAASGDYAGAWGQLYQEIYYRLHRNVKECAKNRGVSALDYIEDEGMLPAVVAIAREVFGGAA